LDSTLLIKVSFGEQLDLLTGQGDWDALSLYSPLESVTETAITGNLVDYEH